MTAPAPPFCISSSVAELADPAWRLSTQGRRSGESAARGRLRALSQPHVELRSVAARHSGLSATIPSLHGEVRALLAAARLARRGWRGFRVRRGERDTEAIDTAVRLAREGYVVVMFPEGTRRRRGCGRSGAARTPERRGLRSTRVSRSFPPRSRARTGCCGWVAARRVWLSGRHRRPARPARPDVAQEARSADGRYLRPEETLE